MVKRRRNAISGQFSARLIEMLESPAFRALSRGAHQVLARIEVEHAHHGGADNGELPVTYDQFVEYGLHRHAIAAAIRELVALGFIQITAKGCAGNERYRRPNLFRLTYRPAKDATISDGTHEWRSVKSFKQAEALAQQARREMDQRAHELGLVRARARKKSFSDGFRPISVTVSDINKRQTPVTETGTTCVSAETITTSISRGGRPILGISERGPSGGTAPEDEPSAPPADQLIAPNGDTMWGSDAGSDETALEILPSPAEVILLAMVTARVNNTPRLSGMLGVKECSAYPGYRRRERTRGGSERQATRRPSEAPRATLPDGSWTSGISSGRLVQNRCRRGLDGDRAAVTRYPKVIPTTSTVPRGAAGSSAPSEGKP
jgi:hypothetical protein